MQYLDESGNVLYEVNDSDKIFKMVNGKISSLAGAGTRMVVADSSGNLSPMTYSILPNEFDLNTLTWTINTGGYRLQNAPNGEFIFVENIAVASGVIKQKAYSSGIYIGSHYQRWERECIGGTWTAWRTGLADSTLAGTGTRMVVADANGNLSASGVITKLIIQQPYSYTALYGINYINSGTGGQNITLPVAVSGAEVEIISKTQGLVTYLTMSGSNKIYDINGNDVTSTYTAVSALASIKRLRFIGSVQIDRSGTLLNSGAVDWVLVEKDV